MDVTSLSLNSFLKLTFSKTFFEYSNKEKTNLKRNIQAFTENIKCLFVVEGSMWINFFHSHHEQLMIIKD